MMHIGAPKINTPPVTVYTKPAFEEILEIICRFLAFSSVSVIESIPNSELKRSKDNP